MLNFCYYFAVFPRRISIVERELHACRAVVQRREAFTLLEMLVVMGIIALLMVLVAPAFTSLKSAGDVAGAAYTVKGVLDTARTYAQANNTYTWVGFFEENVSLTTPGTAGVGRLVMSIVASKDGTTVYNPSSTTNPDPIDPTKLSQVGKLVKIENVHLPLFQVGSGTGDTFDTRLAVQNDGGAVVYNYSRFGEINAGVPNTAPYTTSQFPFQYPLSATPPGQYTFRKTLQFSPTGESRINSTYDMRRVIEIGLLQTHGTATPVPTSGAGTSTVTFSGNVAAVQVTGVGGSVKIYQR